MSGAMSTYVMPAIQALGGAGMTAMGMPQVGLPMAMGGVSQLAGGGMGAPHAAPPQMAPAPSMASTGAAMPPPPATPPPATAGAPPSTPPSMAAPDPSGGMSTFDATMAGLGPVGASYMSYVQNMNLLKQRQKTDYAAPHSSSGGQTSPLAFQPQMPIQPPGTI